MECDPMFMPRSRRAIRSAMAGCVLFGLVGCGSIYHRAGDEMSLDMRSRLVTRVREARAAAMGAADAIARSPADAPELTDLAESYAWEYSKAVASVHDVA